MKHSLFVFTISFAVSFFCAVFLVSENSESPPPGVSITMCGPAGSGDIKAGFDGKFVGALPGWGNYHYVVSTDVDSAQYYFDQGLSMYYSYHMKEATASFKESARFDPTLAMAYWGEALSMGPYYNAAHSYSKPEVIREVLARMNQYSTAASPKEKYLIEAMNTRYNPELGGGDLKTSEDAYAKKLKVLMQQYPTDQDIRMLYVDAIMLMHAWDFWDQSGNAKAWTPEVVSICEQVLKENPEHPAALHYHIHLTEASDHPQVALPNADVLKKLLPGVAHMVHMASHEYQRNGLYPQGVEVNDQADNNLLVYKSMAENLNLNRHSSHYFAVQSYCALSGGMYEIAMKSAYKCRRSVSPTPQATYDQYLYMLPALTNVRLGKWDEILADTSFVDSGWAYAGLIRNFALGMAHINKGNKNAAQAQLKELRKKTNDTNLLRRRIPFNAPADVMLIPEQILNASILFAEKKYIASIAALEEAIEAEDKLIYTEPNDWPVPARQYLGAFLIKLKKYREAEAVYRRDLIKNPGNGWSNLGLYQSLMAQKQDAASCQREYIRAFVAAESIPTSSVVMSW
jgi:tetratricopeptide (TPR) repeat protein